MPKQLVGSFDRLTNLSSLSNLRINTKVAVSESCIDLDPVLFRSISEPSPPHSGCIRASGVRRTIDPSTLKLSAEDQHPAEEATEQLGLVVGWSLGGAE